MRELPPRTPFVGRESELDVFAQLLDEARSGRAHFVVIEGEAGMGKSRLLDEIVAHPGAAGFSLYRASAEELHPRPFGLLADALAIDGGSSDPDRLAVAQLLDAGPDVPQEATDRRYRVIEGVIHLVERHAIEGPALLCLDDVHWADPSSAQALSLLCRRLVYLPVLVLMACRPLPRPTELARLLDHVVQAGGRLIHLAPLREAAVKEMATARLKAPPGPVLWHRLEGAAGNPFFVLELLDVLAEEGALKVEAEVAEATSALEPPPSMRMTVLRRLAFLSPAALELLRTASLLGRSFSAAQIALVTGEPLLDVLSALEEPTAAGFVTASGETFAFRHDVVREALYLELPPAVRKGRHLHVGRTLAAAGAPAAEVGNHLAIGAEFGDREAVGWLRRAARELRSRAPAMAAELLEKASALLPPGDPEWASLVREQIRALGAAGRVREAAVLAEDALVHITDRLEAFKLGLIRVDLLFLQARHREATGLADQLLAVPALPADIRAQLVATAAVGRAVSGDFDAALAAVEDLGPFTDAHPDSLPASYCSFIHGYVARAQGFFTRAVELAERGSAASEGHRLVQALLYLGVFQVGVDRLDEARATLERAGKQLERLGYAALMHEYHWYLALLHFTAGSWDDALAEAVTSRELREGSGASGLRSIVGGDPTPLIHLHRGDVGAAVDALVRIDADRTLTQTPLARIAWLEPMRAVVQDGAGQAQAALRSLESWRQTVLGMTFLPDYRGVARTLVWLCRAERLGARLDQVVEEAAEAARRAGDVPSVTGTALLLRGMVEGDPDALVEAVEAFRAGPRLFDRAEACAEAAVHLLSSGRDEEARALLTEAFNLYEELGAQRGEAALAAEIRRFGLRRGARGHRQRAATGWSALTGTEKRIVALVAEGLTNGEIGDRLYISRGTVATHLRSVFRKVAVSSRTELAAEATRHLA